MNKCEKKPDKYTGWWKCERCRALWLEGVYKWDCYHEQEHQGSPSTR